MDMSFGRGRPEKRGSRWAEAIAKSQAVIEFDTDGRILDANEKFLGVMGYDRTAVVGRPHSMFVDPAEAQRPEYKEFWARLRRGETQQGEFRRIANGGREVWVQGTYMPVADASGKIVGVVKLAADITAQKRASLDAAGQLSALNRSQAVIEFDLDGTILAANENFLNALGYRLDEIKGRHHSMFVDQAYGSTPAYRDFWRRLGAGEFMSDEFHRVGKGGRTVWIRATYNPILDATGKPIKVVKFAADITAEKTLMDDYKAQIAALGRSQAFIAFDLEGKILDANDNFLGAMGYRLDEIKGQHHRLFADAAFASSDEYRQFWQRLRSGEFFSGTFRRIGKGGREVWIQASYNPVFDRNGQPYKVVKYASDVTAQFAARKSAVASAEQTSGNVHAMSVAVEELDASVSEVSSNMMRSKEAVDEIHVQTTTAGQSTARLDQAARSMDSVVQLIQQIASQITLLALNATIESARAGEAGRGFAVVATEVKALAQQSAKAAESISKEIASMQEVSGEVVGALGTIGGSVDTMRELVSAIASAIEEQNAVTKDISVNMQTAAAGVRDITRNLSEALTG